MKKQVNILNIYLGYTKKLLTLLCFFIPMMSSYSQNINLSHNLGDINCKYSYGKILKALGKPDSIYSFDPKNMNPIQKSLAYNELFYDNNLFVVRFSYSMSDTLRKKTRKPSMTIYKGSSFTLNGDSLSALDSTYVVRKYGKPKSVSNYNNKLTISYHFRKNKYFSIMTFYFNKGIIEKIKLHFGKF